MVAPNPVGINQQVLISIQLDKTSPTATSYNRGDLFKGFTLTITKPDGSIETKGPFTSWPTSGTFLYYTPTMLGTYTLKANFPGQWVNGSFTSFSAYGGAWTNGTGTRIYENRYYSPSNSASVSMTVQQQQVPFMENNPLPTGYWTVPINAENKGWSQISDNWLMLSYDKPGRSFTAGNAFSPYTSAPDSAHLLWSLPIEIGGMMGGAYEDRSYYTGLSYEQFYTPIILQGQIIYSDHGPSSGTVYGTRCLDLYTGKQLWYLENVTIAFAQTLEIDTPNEHGGLPYLWSTSGIGSNQTWIMWEGFSANTGQPPRMRCTITNVTAGTNRFGPNGELLSYTITGTGSNARMILWNSTRAIYRIGSIDVWSPTLGAVYDGTYGIEWNISAPMPLTNAAFSISDINPKEGYMFAMYTDNARYPRVVIDAGYKLPTPDISGQYQNTLQPLWVQNRTDIEAELLFQTYIQDGVYARWQGSTLKLYCYDMQTGTQKWTVGPITNNGWAYFSYLVANAYGKIYVSGYDGHVRAFNIADGGLAWDYYFGDAGYENAYGTYPTYNGFTIADNKLFICNDEHSSDSVLWRGGKLHAIDTTTGKGVWNISGWLRNTVVSNGYLTSYNCLDGQVYVIGKGPTKLTISAPQTAVPLGTGLMITGSITDQSPGKPGIACVSDDNMANWMAYQYMQKQLPASATGVSIKLTAIDSNANTIVIGTVTSDINGAYGKLWSPSTQGQYQIIASFDGTNSYGGSTTSTYLAVGPAQAAPVPTSTPSQTTQPTVAPTTTIAPTASPSAIIEPGTGISTETLLIIGAAVIIIAIVTAAAVLLRKRK